MTNFFQITFVSLLSLALVQCSKSTSNSCRYTSPPDSFFFLIKKNNDRLPDSVLNGIRISYSENGARKYLTDLTRATEEGYALGVMTTRLIGIISADQVIKDFIIEYPSTYSNEPLHIDYQSPSKNNGCAYSLQQVNYNGHAVSPDPAITVQRVYLLE